MEGQIGGATTTTQFYEAILNRCAAIKNSLGGFNNASPLHVAVHMGDLEMVNTILGKCPSMCLAHDQDGMNPIHVAAIQGHGDVIKALYKANPHAALERASDGQTILHLCVKHNQLNALKNLLELTKGHGDHFLNAVDKNEDTILQLAVTGQQFEIVEFILKHTKVEKDSINKNDMTAVDIQKEQTRHKVGDARIEQALKQANAKPAMDALNRKANDAWYEEQRTSLMVVASLIATIAFQVGIDPPGGVWQDNKKPEGGLLVQAEPPTASDAHQAGFAIWSYLNYDGFRYRLFNTILFCNTMALLSSLSVVLLLIAGFRCKRYCLVVLRVTLWITVTATTLTYGCAVFLLLGHNITDTFLIVLSGCIVGWILLITSITSTNIVHYMSRMLHWQKESIEKFFRKRFSASHQSTKTPTNDHNNGETAITIERS